MKIREYLGEIVSGRLQNECEERERCAGDAAAARRHGAELDALLAAARADLQACRQRAADLEEACRARDQVWGTCILLFSYFTSLTVTVTIM